MRVLFVGINPGLRSAAVGHHLAGHSNRFWTLLADARLVPGPVTFEDDVRLPEWGFGITNLVARPTRGIDDLGPADYARGRRVLLAKIRRFAPEVVALLGVTLARVLLPAAGGGPKARRVPLGRHAGDLAGARVWVLPNPSGRNANYSYDEMRSAFRGLRRRLGRRTHARGRGQSRMPRSVVG